MIEQKMTASGNVEFWDLKRKEAYGSIVAGLAWPWVKPGFVVVLGVHCREDVNIEAYPLVVLAESAAEDTGTLFREALRLREDFCVETFYADTKNENMVALLEEWNGDRRARQLDTLSVFEAPHCVNEIIFYLDMIRKHTVSNRKRLSFGRESAIPGHLLGLTPEDISKATTLDHPVVAAIGYALSALATWRPQRENSRQQKAKVDFDPHTYDRPGRSWPARDRVITDFDPRKI